MNFEPGPIGLELEPGTLAQDGKRIPCCRVQRFVDGGPNQPGPARASGSIRPGDVVVAVNGSPVRTYEQTISILKQSTNLRKITFQSPWADFLTSPPFKKNGSNHYGKTNDGNCQTERLPGRIRASSFDASVNLDVAQQNKHEKFNNSPIHRTLQKALSETWKHSPELGPETGASGDSTNTSFPSRIEDQHPEKKTQTHSTDTENSEVSIYRSSTECAPSLTSPLRVAGSPSSTQAWSSSTTRSADNPGVSGEICDQVSNFASWLVSSNKERDGKISGYSHETARSGRILESSKGILRIKHETLTSDSVEHPTAQQSSDRVQNDNEHLRQALVCARLDLESLKVDRRRLERAERENSELNQSLAILQEDAANQRIQNKVLEDRHRGDLLRTAELVDALKEANEARSMLKSDLQTTESMLQKKAQEFEKVFAEKDELQTEIEGARQRLRAAEDGQRRAINEAMAMSQELAKVKVLLEISSQEQNKLQGELETTERALSMEKTSSKSAHGEIESIRLELKKKESLALKTELEAKASIKEFQVQHEESNDSAQKELDCLRKRLKLSSERARNFESDANRTIKTLHDKVKAAYHELEVARRQVAKQDSETKRENFALQQVLQQSEADAQFFRADADALRDQLREADQIAKLEIGSLRDALEEAKDLQEEADHAAQTEIKSLQISLERIQDQFKDESDCAHLEIQSLREALGMSQDQLKDYCQEIQSLQEVSEGRGIDSQIFCGEDVEVGSGPVQNRQLLEAELQRTHQQLKALAGNQNQTRPSGNDNAQREIKSLREHLQLSEVRIMRLQSERNRLFDINVIMRETLDELCQERDLLHEKIAIEQQDESVFFYSATNEQCDSDELVDQLERAEEELRRLKAELKRSEAAHEETCLRSRDIEDKLIERSVELQTELTEKEEELNACRLQRDAVRQTLKSIKEANKPMLLEASSSNHQEQYRVLQSSSGDGDASLSAQGEFCEMQSEINLLRQKIRSHESSFALLQKEKEETTSRCDQLSIELLSCKEILAEKEVQVTTSIMESEKYQSAVEELEHQLARRTKELSVSERDVESLRKHYSEIKSRFSHVVEMAKKEGEITASELIRSEDDLAKLKRRNSEIDNILKSIRCNLQPSEQRATTSLNKLTAERDSMNDWKRKEERGHHRFSIELQSKINETEVMRHDCKNLKHEVLMLKEQIVTLNQEKLVIKSEFEANLHALEEERDSLAQRLSQQGQREDVLIRELCDAKHEAAEIKRELQILRKRVQGEQELNVRCERKDLLEKQEKQNNPSEELQLETKEEFQLSQTELRVAEDALKRTRNEAGKLSVLLDAVQCDHESKVHKSETKAAKLAKVSQVSERAFALMELEVDSTESRHLDLDIENTEMSENMRENEDTIENLQGLVSQLREEYVDYSDCEDTKSFFGLPRAELRALCQDLQDQLTEEEKKYGTIKSELAFALKQIADLQAERVAISDEMTRAIDANSHLKDKIDRVESNLRDAESEAQYLRSSLESVQHAKLGMENKTSSQSFSGSLPDEMGKIGDDSEAPSFQSAQTVRDIKRNNEQLTRRIGHLQRDLAVKGKELATAVTAAEENGQEAKESEAKLMHALEQLSERNLAIERAEEKAKRIREKSGHELEIANAECLEFRMHVAHLQNVADDLEKQLRLCKVKEHDLVESRDQLESTSSNNQKLQEETLAKLFEASQVVMEQNRLIKELEAGKMESECRSSSLAFQVESLQDAIKNAKAASDNSGEHYMVQLQLMEKRNAQLSAETFRLNGKCASLRDDLRQSKRKCDEFRQSNGALRKRVKQLSESIEQEEADTAQIEKIELQTALNHCQSGFESKQLEIDHLKARIEVLNTTIQRLKSDYLFIQTATRASSDEAHHSEGGVGYTKQNLEYKLLWLSEDVVETSTDAFNFLQRECAKIAMILLKGFVGERFPMLDLAGAGAIRTSQIYGYFKELSCRFLPKVLLFLHERTTLMERWKGDRRGFCDMIRSNTEWQDARVMLPDSIDESSNMDNLAIDSIGLTSKSDHDNLSVKDDLMGDFDKLLSLYTKSNKELVRKLNVHTHKHIKEDTTTVGIDSRVMVAGELLARFFEGQDLRRKNAAFWRWTAQTSSCCSVEKQDDVAAELSHQLETTREKLSILKRHLKKSRRAPLKRIQEVEPSSRDNRVDV